MVHKRYRYYAVIIFSMIVVVVALYGLTYRNAQSVSFYAVLANKDDVSKQVYAEIGSQDVEIVDVRLVANEEYLKLIGSRSDSSDKEGGDNPLDLIWVALTKGKPVSNLPMLSKEQQTAVLSFDAHTGFLIGIAAGTEADMSTIALNFTNLPNLDGTVNIIAKEPALPENVPPTNTPATQ